MNRQRNGQFAFDVIIVGGGPAGLNTAIVLARSRRRVLIVDAGKPRNRASHGVHNFLSRDAILPARLNELGRHEALRYGAKFIRAQVVDATSQTDVCRVTLAGRRTFTSRKLLLATGISDPLPQIDGLAPLYGISVHHCPYCDGWEYSGEPLAILGEPHAATRLALSMLAWSRNLVVCTNGVNRISARDRRRLTHNHIELRTATIQRLDSSRGRLKCIVFEGGSTLARSGIFFTEPGRVQSPLVRKLGCHLDEDGFVICDRKGRTGVANLFLAGDAKGEVQFAIVAAAEGATSGVAINHELQQEDLNSTTRLRKKITP